ncbi:TPA: hypothetical protein ACGXM6_004850 [Bacillus cereus]
MNKPYIANFVEVQNLKSNTNLIYDDFAQVSFVNSKNNIKNSILGPDTTALTETLENTDPDEMYLGLDTTMKTATLDPDTTALTFTVENNDTDEHYCEPETTRITKSIENIDADEYYS